MSQKNGELQELPDTENVNSETSTEYTSRLASDIRILSTYLFRFLFYIFCSHF